ncbi:MAG TPA: DinB family protein [Fimbriimonadaceae bacterium]|nr:DinB family protein [Fimbriimonadaceae bacterium]HRJ96558.1 DinB family protein [Fimbriimonadaceae bacterium]
MTESPDVASFVRQAKAEFRQAQAGLLRALRSTAEDRLGWSPSPSARSPIEIGAHAAIAVEAMLGNLDDSPFPLPAPADADAWFREEERRYATLELVAQLLETNGAAYENWLDALDEPRLSADIALPFGMGSCPRRVAIGFMPMHLNWHTAQIEYIQTIYGDRDTHF